MAGSRFRRFGPLLDPAQHGATPSRDPVWKRDDHAKHSGDTNAAKVRMGGWYDMARSGGVKFIALGVSAVLES